MSPQDFAAACRMECDAMLATYTGGAEATFVGERLRAAALDVTQKGEVMAALEGALRDAFYTVLLALDGAASLGGQQQRFSLNDDEGLISGDGRLEAAAWEAFHGDDP